MSERARIGRVPVDRVTFGEALAAVERLVDAKTGGMVFTPNVDHVVLAEHDELFAAAYESAALSLADGVPVVWASRLLGPPLPEKVSGSDLVGPLLERAAQRGFAVYLLGGAPGSAERAARALVERGVRVAGHAAPAIEAEPSAASCDAAARAIAEAAPELVLVGLGAPKQEKLAHAIASRVRPAVLLCVGATIDFLAGAAPRAPALVSRVGLEWLYRLALEPRRLWRRYLLRDPEFARIVLDGLRARHGDLRGVLEKVAVNTGAIATAPIHLRTFDRVGRFARTRGRPIVENLGSIEVGDRFQVRSAFVPARFSTAPGAELRIGDGFNANFGLDIAVDQRVVIGSRVNFGPYVTVSDRDPGSPAAEARPVVIGDDVWLAARVRVAPGVTIGAKTVVSAGSVVDTSLPANVIASGVPARVIRERGRNEPSAAPEPPPRRAPRAPDVHGVIVADFTAVDVARALERDEALGPSVRADVAPFDQVVQTLESLADATQGARDFAFVWTRPERVSRTFAALAEGKAPAESAMLADVDAFAARVLAARARFVFVASFTTPPHVRGLGMLDLRAGGTGHALAAMNRRLAERLEGSPCCFLLDASRWLAGARGAYDARLWYAAKLPFSRSVVAAAARDVRAALRGARGEARKLVLVDLDDTVWGGVVGDVGWEKLKLGGHDAVGEAFVDFQRALLALSRRGVALAVVSKNEASVALEAMRSHPEMLLRPEDLAAYRVDWRDKATNVAEVLAELRLGPQSAVFIDDNPLERARVREALPEVLVPDWPRDPTAYVEALAMLRCFDAASLSAEDTRRSRMYAEEREREALRAKVGSLDDWLDGLGTVVRIAAMAPATLPRTTQLLNKTNQMNLRTRRLSEAELLAWAREPGHELWTAHVSDKLGDAGLTGVLGLEFHDGTATLVDWVLSCRVMGRRVEETLAWFAVERARARGAVLRAPYVPTAKNKPCLGFFESVQAFERAGDVFVWDGTRPMPRPRGVDVRVEAGP